MNVQQIIISGLREQLFLNDYLVLPGFGGFVLKHTTAHFSGNGGTVSPPAKTISFNAQLRQNDGILSLYLQSRLKCDAQASMAHLDDFAGYCKGVLQAKRRLNLQGLGFFYLDFEGNTCFEPQHDVNFLSSSFGLEPVSVRLLDPVAAEIRQTEKTDRPAISVTENKPANKATRKLVGPLAASIAIFVLVLLLLNSGQFTGRLTAAIFGSKPDFEFKPVNYPPLQLQSADAGQPAYLADANGVAVMKLDNNKEIHVQVVEKPIETRSNSSRATVGKSPFEIVAGCFSLRGNAERMVKKLTNAGIAARISPVQQKGMHVVSVGFVSREAALQALGMYKSGHPAFWLREIN